eukprot:3042857-Rhodomonas_salina.3
MKGRERAGEPAWRVWRGRHAAWSEQRQAREREVRRHKRCAALSTAPHRRGKDSSAEASQGQKAAKEGGKGGTKQKQKKGAIRWGVLEGRKGSLYDPHLVSLYALPWLIFLCSHPYFTTRLG